MNLKSIVIAGMLLGTSVSAKELRPLPILEKEDFTHAREIKRMGKSVLRVDLTPSGVDKITAISEKGLGEKIRFKIGKNIYHFKLNKKITDDQLLLGPFSSSQALKIEHEINQKTS